MDSDGHQYESVLSLWLENSSIALETSCDCSLRAQCQHCAALIIFLEKNNKLETIYHSNEQPTTKTHQSILTENPKTTNESITHYPPADKKFILRIEKRPSTNELAWLPEVFARAGAIYGDKLYALKPSGILKQKERDRASEIEALNTLYALDLLPDAGTPPNTLKKQTKLPYKQPLWAPNQQEWNVPEFYWQRFYHKAIPALEKRGWRVEISAGAIRQPLQFKATGWKAEIVEEGRGWFNLTAGFEIDGEHFDLQPILATLVDYNFLEVTEGMPDGQEFLVFLPSGQSLTVPIGRFRKLLQTLGVMMEFDLTGGPIRIQEVEAAILAQDKSLDTDHSDTLQSFSEKLTNFSTHTSVNIPKGLKATLRDYQVEGFKWMQFLARHNLNGIMADDMGLGKTLQTITHILSDKEQGISNKPTLVIAPTSVVMNWQREISKFAPDLCVLILQGSRRHELFKHIDRNDVILSSYALIHRDLSQFLQQTFHLIVLDEAQHIKNSETQVATAIKQLHTKHKLCLSGTPIENHLGELWSLMDFLMPKLLGDQETFNTRYRNPIEKNKDVSAKELLNKIITPLTLRRTKHTVAKELPPKTEIIHEIEFNEGQNDLYETVRSTMDKQVRQALAAKGKEAPIIFLDALLKLRQICCHPALLKKYQSSAESSKFSYLKELLDTLLKESHKVIIFSQFTSMLDIIREHLSSSDIEHLILTGETKDRQSLVELFQAGDIPVFLISLKAGGTGLTLTEADTVIHYDPWWNPAVENQATDRAYRIGQTKPVFVHKLLCQNTVEERIHTMQQKKGAIAESILDGAMDSLELTPETMSSLLEK